ncbi:hypothetical protein KY495_23260 [Massilia sp. PAMC28688]|uniref:hypothetical protein n=1 Tax=Massilia sp. PAMC28688 TaxID=2861283 RepID=UPI001C637EBF|nr:hypothetical protein [Massilia sp. PAMC28688]QYF93539.1 hypothetical protein KY495_23260 [Massilia sp. PAMC28688]
MAHQDTSIGTISDSPVDGIQGSNPGTQQPDGAHVNAGKEKTPGSGGNAGVGQPPSQSPAAGQNHEGVTQPGGVTGAMGRPARRTLQPGQLDQMVRGKFNGSLSLAGQTIGVRIGCGAMSLQQTTRH